MVTINLGVSLVNQVHSAGKDLPFRQSVSCMILLSSHNTWITTGERKANQNYRLGEAGNKARASWHGATWFHVKNINLLKVLNFCKAKFLLLQVFYDLSQSQIQP